MRGSNKVARPPMTEKEVLWCKEREAEGYSAAQIARSLGRNPETVRRALRGDTHQGVGAPLGAPDTRGPTVRELAPPTGLGAEALDGVRAAVTEQTARESLARLKVLLAQPRVADVVTPEVLEKAREMGLRLEGSADGTCVGDEENPLLG